MAKMAWLLYYYFCQSKADVIFSFGLEANSVIFELEICLFFDSSWVQVLLMGRDLTNCLAQSEPIVFWVKSQLIVELEVGSLFGLRWVQVLLGWKSTYNLTQSRPIFYGVSSQLIIWSGASLFCKVGSQLKLCFQPFTRLCIRESIEINRSFEKIPWDSISFMHFYAHAPCRLKKIPIV